MQLSGELLVSFIQIRDIYLNTMCNDEPTLLRHALKCQFSDAHGPLARYVKYRVAHTGIAN